VQNRVKEGEQMDPEQAVIMALTLANAVIDFIKGIQKQSGLTPEEIAALADAQDLQNKEDIKKLLAL
jgi:hypothetical protein